VAFWKKNNTPSFRQAHPANSSKEKGCGMSEKSDNYRTIVGHPSPKIPLSSALYPILMASKILTSRRHSRYCWNLHEYSDIDNIRISYRILPELSALDTTFQDLSSSFPIWQRFSGQIPDSPAARPGGTRTVNPRVSRSRRDRAADTNVGVSTREVWPNVLEPLRASRLPAPAPTSRASSGSEPRDCPPYICIMFTSVRCEMSRNLLRHGFPPNFRPAGFHYHLEAMTCPEALGETKTLPQWWRGQEVTHHGNAP
jgi:hypothetical protein